MARKSKEAISKSSVMMPGVGGRWSTALEVSYPARREYTQFLGTIIY